MSARKKIDTPPMKCHWVIDEKNGDKVLIPGCYGSIGHPDNCTCDIEGSEFENTKQALEEAENKIARLIASGHQKDAQYQQLWNMNQQLRAKVIELQARVDAE